MPFEGAIFESDPLSKYYYEVVVSVSDEGIELKLVADWRSRVNLKGLGLVVLMSRNLGLDYS